MNSGNIVEFKGVQKTYDGRNLVIGNLDLAVRKGEFLTLLGGSGSGKTTTLMMLAGFETPTRGHIMMNNVPIEHVAPHRRGIGVVFQNYALFPHMTVEQNLAYPLRMRGESKAEIARKVGKQVEMVRLHGMEQRRPQELSGGQQQRVALARSLVFEPELVLMDEPLGALDKALREHMQYEIKQIHRDLGVTIVYVTHDQSEALAMSDRIAIFHNGDIVQIDSPHDLYEKPTNVYVAGFIGENNILTGIVERSQDNMLAVDLDCGQVVSARPAGGTADAGATASLTIRPDRLVIGEDARSLGNSLLGRVLDVTYLGDHFRAQIDIGGDQKIIVRKPSGQLSGQLVSGDEILVGWRIEDGLLFF